MFAKKGHAKNVEGLLSLKKRKSCQKSLFEDENADKNSSTSFDDSEDDVVPKKLYKKMEEKYDKEVSRHMSLEKKLKIAKEKIDSLTDLNLKFQTRFFTLEPPSITSTPIYSEPKSQQTAKIPSLKICSPPNVKVQSWPITSNSPPSANQSIGLLESPREVFHPPGNETQVGYATFKILVMFAIPFAPIIFKY